MPDNGGPELDIDAPQEVTAAAGTFTAAVRTAAGSADGSAGALRPWTTPESDLDRTMCGQLEWVRATFEAAARSSSQRADDILVEALFGTAELEATDLDSGSRFEEI